MQHFASLAALAASAKILTSTIKRATQEAVKASKGRLLSSSPAYAQMLAHHNVVVVSSVDECEAALRRSRHDGVVGLDVEARPRISYPFTPGNATNGKPRTALLQLAFTDLTLLVRLTHTNGEIPDSLRDLLSDASIQKAGIGIKDDTKRLRVDWGIQVNGELELTSLVPDHNPGMKTLCARYFGVAIDKSKSLSCSDWEVDELSYHQVLYAAADAFYSRQLALLFQSPDFDAAQYKAVPLAAPASPPSPSSAMAVSSLLVDTAPLRSKPAAANKLSSIAKAQTRVTPLYDNYVMFSDTGVFLCYCNKKKTEWYCSRGLADYWDPPAAGPAAEQSAQSPDNEAAQPFYPPGRCIRLRFPPKGDGSIGAYGKDVLYNRCVVCGLTCYEKNSDAQGDNSLSTAAAAADASASGNVDDADSLFPSPPSPPSPHSSGSVSGKAAKSAVVRTGLVRFHVVPLEIRRHFPVSMKSHASQDVLLLCVPCQRVAAEGTQRLTLAMFAEAPPDQFQKALASTLASKRPQAGDHAQAAASPSAPEEEGGDDQTASAEQEEEREETVSLSAPDSEHKEDSKENHQQEEEESVTSDFHWIRCRKFAKALLTTAIPSERRQYLLRCVLTCAAKHGFLPADKIALADECVVSTPPPPPAAAPPSSPAKSRAKFVLAPFTDREEDNEVIVCALQQMAAMQADVRFANGKINAVHARDKAKALVQLMANTVGLDAMASRFRADFLATMKPRFLSPHWQVHVPARPPRN